MAIELTDDGTLDTVFRCTDCGEETRCNYDDGTMEADATEADYLAWRATMQAELTAEHTCGEEA